MYTLQSNICVQLLCILCGSALRNGTNPNFVYTRQKRKCFSQLRVLLESIVIDLYRQQAALRVFLKLIMSERLFSCPRQWVLKSPIKCSATKVLRKHNECVFSCTVIVSLFIQTSKGHYPLTSLYQLKARKKFHTLLKNVCRLILISTGKLSCPPFVRWLTKNRNSIKYPAISKMVVQFGLLIRRPLVRESLKNLS